MNERASSRAALEDIRPWADAVGAQPIHLGFGTRTIGILGQPFFLAVHHLTLSILLGLSGWWTGSPNLLLTCALCHVESLVFHGHLVFIAMMSVNKPGDRQDTVGCIPVFPPHQPHELKQRDGDLVGQMPEGTSCTPCPPQRWLGWGGGQSFFAPRPFDAAVPREGKGKGKGFVTFTLMS